MSEHDAIIRKLRDTLAKEQGLSDLLERSLVKARETAGTELNADLFAALEWPENIDQYESYLKGFIRWVPQQSDAAAWQNLAPGESYAKEVKDRLTHFYWLVDQEVDGSTLQDCDTFREWITEFARQWGSFLDTPESFSPEILQSFIDYAPEYRIHESLVDGMPNTPSGWLTFNQFFARQLNGGLRPITEPTNNRVVTSPADCRFAHRYAIDADSNIPATAIKNLHQYGNITELIAGSVYSESFSDGTFAHYELMPASYHRFHLPVQGLVKESFRISGKAFLEVALQHGELAPQDSSTSGFEFSQNRGVITVDTSASEGGDIGIVSLIAVGMSHVSSVVLTAVEGTQMAKGEESGYFQFGGSDIIILFQKGAAAEIDTREDYRLVGTSLARCPLLS